MNIEGKKRKEKAGGEGGEGGGDEASKEVKKTKVQGDMDMTWKDTFEPNDKAPEGVPIPGIVVLYADETTLDAWKASPEWEMFDLLRKLKMDESVYVICVTYGGVFTPNGKKSEAFLSKRYLERRLKEEGYLKTFDDDIPTTESLIDYVFHADKAVGSVPKNLMAQMLSEQMVCLEIAKMQVPIPGQSYALPAVHVFAEHFEDEGYLPYQMISAFKGANQVIRERFKEKLGAEDFDRFHGMNGTDLATEISYPIRSEKKHKFLKLAKNKATDQLAVAFGWQRKKEQARAQAKVTAKEMLSKSAFDAAKEYATALKSSGDDSRGMDAIDKKSRA